MMRLTLAVLLLLGVAALPGAAHAASCAPGIPSTATSGACIPFNVLIDPSTGLPLGTLAAPVNVALAPGSMVSATTPDVKTAGTIAAGTIGSSFSVLVNNRGTVRFVVTGLSGTGAVLTTQYSGDGTAFDSISSVKPPAAPSVTITADGQYEVKATATAVLRLLVTTAGTAGTVNVTALATQSQGLVGIVGSLPPGANTVGAVIQGGAGASPWLVQWSGQSVAVSNTVAISAASLPLPAGASTSALQSSTQSAAGAQPSAATGVQGVTGGNPVSVTVTNPTPAAPSTVTANQGTAGAQAWSVTQASQPLPAGAATSAKQAAPGTAGTPSADVLSIQGVAGGTPQPMTTTNGALETGGNLAALLARTPPLNAAGQSPVSDPNNAAYASASATFNVGATVTAGRAIYLNCPAAGSVTLTLQGGGSVAYPVTAGASLLPFAVTSVSADTAGCTHQNAN